MGFGDGRDPIDSSTIEFHLTANFLNGQVPSYKIQQLCHGNRTTLIHTQNTQCIGKKGNSSWPILHINELSLKWLSHLPWSVVPSILLLCYLCMLNQLVLRTFHM
jgi:hypothetical protein